MTTIGDFCRMQEAVARAWKVSHFHRLHWLRHGVREDWIPDTPQALVSLPVVTKQDVLKAQRTDPPWGGNLCVDPSQIAQVHLTTGTSGIGQERYAMSAADVEIMGRSWNRQYAAIGLVRGDVAVMTIPVSFFCAGLSALEGARIHGLVPIFTGVGSKELMLDILTHYRATYLYGVESLILQLANLALERGMAGQWRGILKGIQSVGTSPQLLEAADKVFGTKVFEVYGCTQAAAKIANTCVLGIGQGVNHFHGEHLYIEARDPVSGHFVTEGDAELIISTPYREACPMIRFAIRDKVEMVPAGACRCGDPRPGFRPGSLGRIDSMLKIRGVNVWPQQVEQLLLTYPSVRDFRAEVRRGNDGGDELIIRLATSPEADPIILSEGVVQAVREKTMVRPRVIIEALVETPGAYKVQRWEDQRKRGRPAEPEDQL